MDEVATEVASKYPAFQALGYSCETWEAWI